MRLISDTLFVFRALRDAAAEDFGVEAVGEFVVFQSPARRNQQIVGRLRHETLYGDVAACAFNEPEAQADIFVNAPLAYLQFSLFHLLGELSSFD